VNCERDNQQYEPLPDKHASLYKLAARPFTDHGGLIGFLSFSYRLGLKETGRRAFQMLRTLVGAAVDRMYDRRHNMDTTGCIAVSDLDVEGESKNFSQVYAPTPEKSFRVMLNAIPLDLSDFTFIDYGCGKGRTLMIGAEHPFQKIIGIEHSGELARIASSNVAAYRSAHDNCPDIEVLHLDASDFEPPPGPCLFYFYSPFHGKVLQRVVDNIRRSYQLSPRPMVILYSEDRNTLEIPVELFETIQGSRLLKESTVSYDMGALTPLIYAVFTNKEAMEMV
jgi:SAM-dependent methyltransferase